MAQWPAAIDQVLAQNLSTWTHIEGFLRIYCSHRQDDWDELLPFAEFSYNNAMHSSTGETPFMATRGYNPTFTNMPSGAQSNPSAKDRLDRIQEVQKEIRAAMSLAQEKQKEFYDRHRQESPEYAIGDKVWLEARNIKTDRPSTKLVAKRLGPFVIETKVSSHAYKLTLPPTMRIRPVFHISLLTPHVTDTILGRVQQPPPPIIVDEQEEWEVEKILNSRFYYRRLQYLVKWKGFGEEGNTWENADNLEHSADLVREFHQQHPEAPTTQSQRQSKEEQQQGPKDGVM
ncbi:hypothetical protein FRC04_003461 [Tulasnella sp. 424]|nr:hypothetical protein FRC04_003461 [Tulasnella sp. 424]